MEAGDRLCYLSGQWVFCFVLLCFVPIPTLEEVYCSFFGVSPAVAVVCVRVCLPGCPLLLLLVFWGSSAWLGEYRTVLYSCSTALRGPWEEKGA